MKSDNIDTRENDDIVLKKDSDDISPIYSPLGMDLELDQKLDKLEEKEKELRLNKHTQNVEIKLLDVSIDIVSHIFINQLRIYNDLKEYEELFLKLILLVKKPSQFDFVIKGLIVYSIKSIFPKLIGKKEILEEYMITIKNIFEVKINKEDVSINN